MLDHQPVGREPELERLRAFLDAASPSRALVLTGGPGIGKTTLWEAGIDAARARGVRVVGARPYGADARHSFAAMIDLFDGIDPAVPSGLPAPQRSALDVALLRAEPAGVPPEPQAIGLGVVAGLRASRLRSCWPGAPGAGRRWSGCSSGGRWSAWRSDRWASTPRGGCSPGGSG